MAEHQQQHEPPHRAGPQNPPQMNPLVNDSMPANGLLYHPPDQYPFGTVALHASYYPTPPSTHHPGPMSTQGQSQYVVRPRRRQPRATQVCTLQPIALQEG